MSSVSASPRRLFRLFSVAFLCALPFVTSAFFVQRYAKKIDTLPLDHYGGLRWMPEAKGLAFLHRPLRQSPPAPTELWRFDELGGQFYEVGELAADHDWTLTGNHSEGWLLLEGTDGSGSSLAAVADAAGQVKLLAPRQEWTALRSQGEGFFFQKPEKAVSFDQFVEVEDAPDIKPRLEGPFETELLESDEAAPPTPTHSALQIARFNVEGEEMETLFSLPYNRAEEKPEVSLVRLSPDGRFLALVVRFGESGNPGLWVFDSVEEKLLWTRVLVSERVFGIAWSSDSSSVAVSDSEGISILQKALGIESTRLELENSESLKPAYGPGQNLYLYNDSAVYVVDSDRGSAQPLFDVQGQSLDSPDLVLDPMGLRVAFSASPKGYRELVVRDLKSGQNTSTVSFPGSLKEKAQGSLMYQAGSVLDFAWNFWTGRF